MKDKIKFIIILVIALFVTFNITAANNEVETDIILDETEVVPESESETKTAAFTSGISIDDVKTAEDPLLADIRTKMYENDEVIIKAELPEDIEIRCAPSEVIKEDTFYDVWFVKDGQKVEYNTLVKIEFKNMNAGEGRIVKLLDNGSVDVTSDEEGTLKSVWFEVN